MKKILCSNGFKVVLILLLTMAVFCGALLLATYTAEKAISANAEAVAPLSIGGTFDQVVNSQDGLSYEDSHSATSTTEKTEYELYTSFLGGIWWPDVSFNAGDTYFVRFTYYNLNLSTGTFEVDYTETLPSMHSYNLSTSVYSNEVYFFLSPTTRPTSFRFSFSGLSVPVGISSFEIVNLSNLEYYYDSSLYNAPYTINDSAPYFYYFGRGYHRYGFDIPASSAKYYSFDSYYDDGYTRGYDVGTEDGYADGYSTGYTDGYFDGFGEGVILTRAQSYETSINNFQYGTSSYAYNSVGVLQPYDDGYHFLNIGWADMFPSATFNSLKKVGSFQVSCVMDLYTYTESLDTSASPPAHIFSNLSLYQSDVLLKTNEVDFLTNGERIICSCNFPFLDHPDISNNLLVEFIIEPHVTSLNFVDQYVYGDDVWPKTWFTVGAKNADTDYLYTFDIMPIDSSTSYEIGYDAGVNYADGRVNGSSASYAAGYNYGVESVGRFTFPSVIAAAIDVPVQTARNLLNFDFFGTNLNSFVLSLLSFGIVVAVVKLLLGR